MNNFVVSARKYRPSTFQTVIGQSHITNTLKNAIRNKHLAQAFLFCGPRGVGKTTCARILAKTINCHNITVDVEACNECESCIAFNTSQSLNIYELDAASNSSVEDMRALVEQVRYPPHLGAFKIYIIDEVHMLSTAAFNAFLKTLEEPPPYAVFILATTEKHKIIPTILSRCQIFDFNRIQVEDIAKHLAYVATQENVKADTDALHIIAQKADGALRDALSIFDQIVSFAGTNVTYKDVINNLNVLDYDYYFKITDDVREGKVASVLLTFNELLCDGFDGHHFINGLASHFRDLLVCQEEATLKLLEVSLNIRERYKTQAKQTPASLLLRLLEVCSKCDVEYRAAKNQRLHVELALIKMCSLNGVVAEKKTADAIELGSLSGATEIAKEISSSSTPSPVVNVAAEKPPIEKKQEIPVQASIKSQPTMQSIDKPLVSKTVSISAALSGKTQATKSSVVNEPTINESEKVTQEYLLKVWNEYSSKQRSAGKYQLHSTMNYKKPVLLENNIIELEIQNESQAHLLNEEKQELMDYLRRELKNYQLQLRTKVVEQQSENTAYTNKEKYQEMVKKNPDLEEFRRQLGFELEL